MCRSLICCAIHFPNSLITGSDLSSLSSFRCCGDMPCSLHGAMVHPIVPQMGGAFFVLVQNFDRALIGLEVTLGFGVLQKVPVEDVQDFQGLPGPSLQRGGGDRD